jgi:hypothetical protein
MLLFLPGMAVLLAQDGTPAASSAGGRAPSVSALPLELARPRHGEEPRFPRDYVIGELGRGGASEEAYRTARLVTAGLAAGNGKIPAAEFPEQKRLAVLQSIGALGTRSWRVGGGRDEGDGGYSFLIRFLGRDRSVTGELYLRRPLAAPAIPAGEPAASGGADAGGETPANAPGADANAPGAGADADAVPGNAAGSAGDAGTDDGPSRWLVDDVLLEGPRSLAEGTYGPAGADMAAYERFF